MTRILIVDDEPDILDSLGTLLELEGHEVASVPRADAILAAVAANDPEVLLQDANMPGLDLDALLRDIRAAHPHVVVLLFTASARAEEIHRRIGSDGVVRKPPDMEELQRYLRHPRRTPT